MKKISLILRAIFPVCLSLIFLTVFLASFRLSRYKPGDIWTQLGITREKGTDNIRESFFSNGIRYYGVKHLKELAAGNTVGLAHDLLIYTKTYINSEAFQNAYLEERKQYQPTAPKKQTITKEAIRKKQIDETRESLANMEKSMKEMDSTIRKSLEPSVALLRNTLKEYQQPDNQMIELFYQAAVSEQQRRQQEYTEDLKKWEVDYPASYKTMVKNRLQKYLALAATVDFEAALVEKNGKMRFVNPSYEAKNDEWKKIFRAGKPVYNEVRAFAEQWLQEL